ncbi:MAG TPA: hypothetical protein VFC81_05770 [Verrucomicrobiae bacterium]|nr:hypothetical protein [Verrucomicrobiae bacterium]
MSPGIAVFLPWVVFVGGCALAWLLRARPALSYLCAVVAMTLGSSVVNINTYALLLAGLAPAAWPAARDRIANAGPPEPGVRYPRDPEVEGVRVVSLSDEWSGLPAAAVGGGRTGNPVPNRPAGQ